MLVGKNHFIERVRGCVMCYADKTNGDAHEEGQLVFDDPASAKTHSVDTELSYASTRQIVSMSTVDRISMWHASQGIDTNATRHVDDAKSDDEDSLVSRDHKRMR